MGGWLGQRSRMMMQTGEHRWSTRLYKGLDWKFPTLAVKTGIRLPWSSSPAWLREGEEGKGERDAIAWDLFVSERESGVRLSAGQGRGEVSALLGRSWAAGKLGRARGHGKRRDEGIWLGLSSQKQMEGDVSLFSLFFLLFCFHLYKIHFKLISKSFLNLFEMFDL